MAPIPFSIRFLPDDRTGSFDEPTDLYLAASKAGILLEQPCGSQGTCGQCRVRLVEGAREPSRSDRAIFDEEELAAGWRLGCQLTLDGPATVEVPALTRSLAGKSFGGDVLDAQLGRPAVTTGEVRGPLLAASPGAPSLLDAVARAAGLVDQALVASPGTIRDLARLGAEAEISVAIHGRELVAAWTGGCAAALGLAIDLGTTSLAAALVSLPDGGVVASASTLNPQVTFGADVISRIRHETHVPGGGRHLTDAARSGLASLVDQLLASSGCTADRIVLAAVAGNPTMMHAWLGVPAASLGRAPYTAAWCQPLQVKAADVQLPIHPNANVMVFPLVRSHVGGDAVAAAIATDLDRTRRTRLLIDLGTNTELLLTHEGRVFVTSAAAGPAFEGVSIRNGMRAAPGAIDVVSIAADGRVTVNIIGGGPARGICGSGLIDAVAELLRAGVIGPAGNLRTPADLPAESGLGRRVVQVDGVKAFTFGEDAGGDAVGGSVVLTARDIREVQLVKGSILAAATLLAREAGIEPSMFDEILVAGAFGNYIRKASALRLGLLPPLDPERVRLVGNAAGVGARLALLDREVMERARELAARADYVDLATDASYKAVFMQSLNFPEPS